MADEIDWLGRVAKAHVLRGDADVLLIQAIRAARKAGFPWAKIGQAMGMTQQGARQHYRPLVEK
jgi:DNA-binding transcriptional MerR regulator